MKNDEQVHPFAIVPVEVMMDNRLTLEMMRVLVTLFSFRNKLTGLAFPTREAISERCGMHPSNISAATTKLVELGWLIKTGVGGYSKATRYTINIPETVAQQATFYKAKCEARKVAQQATVAQSATIAEPATSPVAQSATPQVAQSATRKEQTNRTDQLTERSITPPKKSSPENLLSDINPQIAADYLAIRKAKNLPLTKTALNAIQREAAKLGYSLEQALTVCCEHSWGGFQAAWVLKEQLAGKSPNSLQQENKESTLRAKARLFGSPTEKDVTNETTRL